MLCEAKSDPLQQVGFVEFCQVHIVYSYEKQISKRQSHGLPLVASCCYSSCYNLHLKKKEKRKNRGFVLPFSIGNTAHLSHRLGSEFCWQALLFISMWYNGGMISRSSCCTVPIHVEVSFTLIPPTYHISTHLHTTNRDQRVSKVDHRVSPSQLIKQHFLH